MDVHPPKNGINRYWSIPIWSFDPHAFLQLTLIGGRWYELFQNVGISCFRGILELLCSSEWLEKQLRRQVQAAFQKNPARFSSLFWFSWFSADVFLLYISPHWRVGFLVLYPPASPARPPARLLTHSPHSLTQCAFCVAGVAQSALPRGRMYALASLGSPPFLRGRRGTICTAKGSDVRPGVPWVSASFAWQAWDNVHCQGVGCTPWRPLGLRLFCVAGVAQCALPRGRMYALASLGSPPLLRVRRGTMCTAKGWDVRPGVPWVSASFAWQAWHNVHCQGVGCTPWRPLGLRLFCAAGVAQCALPRGRMYALASLGSPPLLRGRRGTMCTAKGSDVRPGVPWVSASFAWQAWDNVHFAWQAWDNVHCQGIGCTAWRPLGSASFAWQAWDNVHCQGGWMYALASLGLRFFCVAGVGQCAFYVAGVGQCALPRGRMYALASLGLRLFCVAGVGQCALPRGWSTPWRPLGSASFAWQALTHSLSHSLSHSTHSLSLTLPYSLTLTH